MAHWAQIDENDTVRNVIVMDNTHPDGRAGFTWLGLSFGGHWVQTSYNTFAGEHLLGGTPLRKNYASVGYTYDEARDAFVPPTPYPSWILNNDTCQWDAPVPKPDDGLDYAWDEETISWVLTDVEE
jgi:hypothetical protein